MSESEYAGRQLQVIRSLMERATIYRALSAPTALAGGLLSLAAYGLSAWLASCGRPLSPFSFILLWLAVLVLTGATNLAFLARDATRRGEPFLSFGMRCAFLSSAPAFVFAGVLTIVFWFSSDLVVLSWIILYGIGLLATQHFAPRSLILLGLAFFLTGCGLLLGLFLLNGPQLNPSALMAATFGLYHLIYAAAVWLRREDSATSTAAATGSGHV